MEEIQNAVVTEQNEPIEALPTGEEGEIHKESKEAMDTGNKEAEAQEPTKGDAQSPQGEPLVPQEEKAEEVEPSLSDKLAKKQEELAQREALLVQKEKEMERQDLRKEVKESLLKVGIGEGLIDPVLNLNLSKEETLAVITGLGENFQKALERKLEEKLEGKTPMASKDSGAAKVSSIEEVFAKALRK